MEKTNKLVFLIVFIIPLALVLTLAWLIIGNQSINSPVIFGYLNGLSIMLIPTLVVVVLGLIIKYLFFNK
jgi:hypothetical protein